MADKLLTKQLLIRIDEKTDQEIDNILNTYTRQEYKNKTTLIRAALELGLKKLAKTK
jgi:hypothetical protein